MAQKLYTESYISDIAVALREVLKTEDKYKVSEMANGVRAAGAVGSVSNLVGLKKFFNSDWEAKHAWPTDQDLPGTHIFTSDSLAGLFRMAPLDQPTYTNWPRSCDKIVIGGFMSGSAAGWVNVIWIGPDEIQLADNSGRVPIPTDGSFYYYMGNANPRSENERFQMQPYTGQVWINNSYYTNECITFSNYDIKNSSDPNQIWFHKNLDVYDLKIEYQQ